MENKVAEVISQTRQNRKMTQEEFASRLGVTPQAVSRWERGNGLPDVSLLGGICEILRISANDLLGIQSAKVVEGNDFEMNEEIKNNLIAEPLVIEFGADFIPYFVEGLNTDYINQCRKQLAKETGILLPLLRIRDSIELSAKCLRILSYDEVMFEKEYNKIGDGTFREVVDETVKVCKEYYSKILNKNLVKIMLDNLEKQYPGVLEALIPDKISYMQVLKELRAEYENRRNLRDLIGILEKIEEKYFEE